MSPRVRWLFLAGLALTLTGVLGLGLTVGQGPDPVVRPGWFVPMYAAGSLLLVGSGLAWLVQWTRRPPPE
jgi:hypothetical protein